MAMRISAAAAEPKPVHVTHFRVNFGVSMNMHIMLVVAYNQLVEVVYRRKHKARKT